jgi:hypothetical protein
LIREDCSNTLAAHAGHSQSQLASYLVQLCRQTCAARASSSPVDSTAHHQLWTFHLPLT